MLGLCYDFEKNTLESKEIYSGTKRPIGQSWLVDHGGGVAAKKVRAVGSGHRRQMIDPNLIKLSQRRQNQLLLIARSTAQYKPKGILAEDLGPCREIDEIHMKDPSLGSRRIKALVNLKGRITVRKRVQRLMRDMCIVPITGNPE